MSLENDRQKCEIGNPYAFLSFFFFFFALACERTFLKTHYINVEVLQDQKNILAGAVKRLTSTETINTNKIQTFQQQKYDRKYF